MRRLAAASGLGEDLHMQEPDLIPRRSGSTGQDRIRRATDSGSAGMGSAMRAALRRPYGQRDTESSIRGGAVGSNAPACRTNGVCAGPGLPSRAHHARAPDPSSLGTAVAYVAIVRASGWYFARRY